MIKSSSFFGRFSVDMFLRSYKQGTITWEKQLCSNKLCSVVAWTHIAYIETRKCKKKLGD